RFRRNLGFIGARSLWRFAWGVRSEGGSGVVGYNVQVAVDTVNHLIVTHEVTNTGSDRSQLQLNGKFLAAITALVQARRSAYRRGVGSSALIGRAKSRTY